MAQLLVFTYLPDKTTWETGKMLTCDKRIQSCKELLSRTLTEQLSSSGKLMTLNYHGKRRLRIKIESTFVSIGKIKFELPVSLESRSVITEFGGNRGFRNSLCILGD